MLQSCLKHQRKIGENVFFWLSFNIQEHAVLASSRCLDLLSDSSGGVITVSWIRFSKAKASFNPTPDDWSRQKVWTVDFCTLIIEMFILQDVGCCRARHISISRASLQNINTFGFYGIKNGSSEFKYMDVFRWLTSPREGFCMHTSIYIMITVAAAEASLGTIFSDYVNRVPGCLLGFCCLGASCLSSQAVSQSTIKVKELCLCLPLYIMELTVSTSWWTFSAVIQLELQFWQAATKYFGVTA